MTCTVNLVRSYNIILHIKRTIYCLAFSLSLATCVFAQELPDFTSLVKKNAAAVVNVSVVSRHADNSAALPQHDTPKDNPSYDYFFRKFFDGMLGKDDSYKARPSFGSGFIISTDGYIITSSHVIRGADSIIVKLHDYREFAAELIGSDKHSDVALLKIDSNELPALKLGSSADLEVGEWVLAIGSPFGFDSSVTAGIISAIGRSLPNENYLPFIQTDVAINPGNSGGPLFNMRGEVIGLNSQIYSRTGGFMGLSFAVPADMVSNIYWQLREKGYVSRGWLGVLIQDVTADLAESFGMQRPHGALISKVLPGSPAEKGGVEIGDVIVEFNKQHIPTSSALPLVVGNATVGEKAPVTVIREGKRRQLVIKVAALPSDRDLKKQIKSREQQNNLGVLRIKVTDLTKAQRKEQNGSDQGVFVEKVLDGPAQQAGIKEGDIILMLNNVTIVAAAQFSTIVDALPKGQAIAILVQRHGDAVFLALRLEEQE